MNKLTNEEMQILNISLIILLIILMTLLIIFSIIFVLKNKKTSKEIKSQNKRIEQSENNIIKKSESLDQAIKKYEKLNEDLDNQKKELISKTNSILGSSREEQKEIILDEIKDYYKKDLASKIREIKNKNDEEIKLISANILVDSMEQVTEDVMPKTTYNVKVDENVKGKIIGREGRMIKAFTSTTGAEIIIEDDSQYVTISCFNPLRREIAFRTLKKLLKQRSIDIDKIEKIHKQESDDIDLEITKIGKDIVEGNLNLEKYIPKELYYYIGRLNYRNSFSQNVLLHSVECAKMASSIASTLGLNVEKATVAAFLHDIGKSIDYEENDDHVESGIKLAKKFNMPDYVINAIESHHDNVPPNNIYSCITKIADILSASRPGIRKNNHNEFIERQKSIEKVCLGFKGVKEAFVFKAGKEVRVIIDPNIIDDDSLTILGNKIEKELSNDPIISTRPVHVLLIRENRHQITSKTKRMY